MMKRRGSKIAAHHSLFGFAENTPEAVAAPTPAKAQGATSDGQAEMLKTFDNNTAAELDKEKRIMALAASRNETVDATNILKDLVLNFTKDVATLVESVPPAQEALTNYTSEVSTDLAKSREIVNVLAEEVAYTPPTPVSGVKDASSGTAAGGTTPGETVAAPVPATTPGETVA